MSIRMFMLALLFAGIPLLNATELAKPPHYTRPVSPDEDLGRLHTALLSGTASEVEWRQRIAIYTSIGELKDAAPLLPLLIEHWPDQPAFQEAQMILLSGQGKFAEALLLGEEVLRRFPGYPTIRANLARVQAAKGDLPAALNSMIAAIGQGPIRVDDWAFMLQLLAKADHDGRRTLQVLDEKITEHPELKGLRYLQVMLLTRAGQLGAARDVLQAHPDIASHPELQRFVADIEALKPITSSPEESR